MEQEIDINKLKILNCKDKMTLETKRVKILKSINKNVKLKDKNDIRK
jgi:hypothetical protein